MNEKVSKGTIADDPLFLEAEKLGYDIRLNDSSNKKSMSFGFFDEEDPYAANEVQFSALQPSLANPSVAEEPAKIVDEMFSAKEHRINVSLKRPSIAQLVNSAKSFKRDRSPPPLKRLYLFRYNGSRLFF